MVRVKKSTTPTKILPVRYQIVQSIFDLYIENQIKDKKVLIIGVFKTIPEYLILKNCNVTILTDDFDYTCEKAKIIRFDGGGELMNKVKEIKKDEYDLIIANPPYDNGNEIVARFVDKPKESIVLMPISKYKYRNLYKHILNLQLVDPKSFKNAKITNNLCVCKLIDKEIDQTFDEIELQTFNPEYKDFYKLNISKISNHKKFILTNKPKVLNSLNPEYDFVVPQKVSNNGVHKTEDCIDYRFNFLFDKDAFRNKNGTFSNVWVNLNYHDKEIRKHLLEFWYKNPLMNRLLFGLNSQYGHINKALPNIDWSKDRDYEHCTLDDIMKWLEEDNQ